MSTHENHRGEEAAKLPSNRSFGLIFAVFFLIVGLASLIRRGEVRWWAIALSALFLVCGVSNSPLLTPLNRVWAKFGLLLHHIVSPVTLAVLFFGAFTPMGWLMRKRGKDSLRMAFDKSAPSYWIVRNPPGPSRESMQNQF